MAEYGITEEGFSQKRLPEIITDDRNQAVSVMQDLVEPGDVVDTSDSAALGRLISLKAPSTADLWEVAQQVYSAFDPNAALGIPLDNLVAYAGLTRNEQTYTTAPVLVSGDVNTLIPQGSVVSSPTTNERFDVLTPIGLSASSASGVTITVLSVTNSTNYTVSYTNNTSTQTISYTSDSSATLEEILLGIKAIVDSSHPTLTATINSSTISLNRTDVFQTVAFTTSSNLGITKVWAIGEVTAENSGPIQQDANTITNISTAVLGWETVTNPVAAISGSNRETDEELRERFRNAKFDRGTNTLEAIYSAILSVSGVQEVVIYENDTNVVDVNGIPPHSFEPIVLGGTSIDIANAIWENKPVGITSFGNTSVPIKDIQGFEHSISFQRPDPVLIHITMDLTTDDNFPANGIDLIKQSLISYFNTNFGIGDDIIYSRLYTPINNIPGHQVNSLFVGTSPSPVGTSNISIDFDQIASLNDMNIIITV